jgi:hypothetical protein
VDVTIPEKLCYNDLADEFEGSFVIREKDSGNGDAD